MRAFLQFLHSDQRGVTTIEYGLIIMALTLAILTAYFLAGDALKEIMASVSSGLGHVESSIGNSE